MRHSFRPVGSAARSARLLVALALAATGLAAIPSAAAAPTSSGAPVVTELADDPPDIDIATDQIACGWLVARTLDILAGADLTVGVPGQTAFDGQPCDGTLTIAAQWITVASTGSISASGVIHAPGPGTGGLGGGAGHGGPGGASGIGGHGGPAYGSASEVSAGSPGGAGTQPIPGGAGGGVIRLYASDGFQINGTIRADGSSGVTVTDESCLASSGGGGSGGYILLAGGHYRLDSGTPSVTFGHSPVVVGGSAVISARGGAGGIGSSGGGGGGGGIVRILSAGSAPGAESVILSGGLPGLGSGGCNDGHSGGAGRDLSSTSEIWSEVRPATPLDADRPFVEGSVALDLRAIRDGGGDLEVWVCRRSTPPTSPAGLDNPALDPPQVTDTADLEGLAGCAAETFAGPTSGSSLYERTITVPVSDGFHGFFTFAVDRNAGSDAWQETPPPSAQVKVIADGSGPAVSFTGANGVPGCLDGRLCVTGDGTMTTAAQDGPGGIGLESVTCRINDGAFTIPCGPGPVTIDLGATDGIKDIEVRAVDRLGNATTIPGPRWVLDRTAPDTVIDSGPSGPTKLTTPSFTFHASEPSTFECSVAAGGATPTYEPCTSGGAFGPLAEGAYTFRVRAVDFADHRDGTPAVRTFTVDTTPPETTITKGPSGLTNDTTPTFEFASTDPRASFSCSFDGGAFSPCTSPHTTAPLTLGTHTFSVRASDAASNVDLTPATRSFRVVDCLLIRLGPIVLCFGIHP